MRLIDDLKTTQKLPLLVAISAAVAALAVGGLAFWTAREALVKAGEDELAAIVEIRTAQLSEYLGTIAGDVTETAQNPLTAAALRDFSAAWLSSGGRSTEVLQQLYITDNPHPTGQKHLLSDAGDGSIYSLAHARHHERFKTHLEARGYYDMFLFDASGNVVYTVFKEPDFATNIQTGEWRDTGLGDVFRAALTADGPAYVDFEPYPPSADAPASFISTAMRNEAGVVTGALAIQLPIDRINAIMNGSAGLGETGEIILVGRDGLMRSQSRFTDEPNILQTRVDDNAVRGAIEGGRDVTAVERAGVPAVAAFSPIDFLGTRWAVVGAMQAGEILAPVAAMRDRLLITVAGSVMLVTLIGVVASRRVTRPLGRLAAATARLGSGVLSDPLPETQRKDEIGDMARVLEELRLGRIEADERAAAEARATAERLARAHTLEESARAFDAAVSATLAGVADAARSMTESAGQMAQVANDTSRRADGMSSASITASDTIQSVAGAAEELAASIATLREDIERASTATRTAADDVASANATIEGLIGASAEIEAVVELIGTVAGQTKLLALNATIEAARAGEAGRGFAVVATEVKSLADETSHATDEINGKVRAAQQLMRAAVAAVATVGTTVRTASEAATAINVAVEQQSGATQDISRNTVLSASSIVELSSSAADVLAAAEAAGEAARRVLGAARLVGDGTEAVRDEVSRFLETLKAA
jgi:methyl-accepting chemotaxis protein